MWQVIWKKVSREVAVHGSFWLDKDGKRTLERRMRGKEEQRKLSAADFIVVSFGKSGRTWLRMLMSRYFQLRHGLSENSFLGFDNLNSKNAGIPRVFFTHDNYLRDYTGDGESKRAFYGKKTVLLVRDPRDTAVSQFFQWKFRMRKGKKGLNDYPDHEAEVDTFDFVMNEDAGLKKVIGFLNEWSSDLDSIEDILIVRYEDLRTNTKEQLARVLSFMGQTPSADQLDDCVEFASVENMRKLEEKQVFWLAGSRLQPKDKSNPNSYKVRRAKIGGYRDYFTDEQVEAIEKRIAKDLRPAFGYHPLEKDSDLAAAADANT